MTKPIYMIKQIYMLEGNIELGPSEGVETLVCTLGNIVGTYGATVWWFPLDDDSGLKIINNYGCDTEQDAWAIINARYKKLLRWYKDATNSLRYWPQVLSVALACHTGWHTNYEYVRGRSTLQQKRDDIVYYPVWRMPIYNCGHRRKLTDTEWADMRIAFLKDGIELHNDCIWGRQIGYDAEGGIKLLDIADVDGKKYL